jgi:putative FmdB family regulatory protein
MPIYEYHCKQCDAKFEKLVKLSAQTAEIECPKCGARHAEKAVSLFGTASSPSSGGPSLAAACGPVS